MTKKQTLKQAVHLARTGKSRDLARAAHALEGCPVGGWGETQQARRNIAHDLPFRSQRDYSLDDFVSALYVVDRADRYRSLLRLEEQQAQESRAKSAASAALAAVQPITLHGPNGATATVRLDGEGYIVHDGGADVTAAIQAGALPAEWLESAKVARVACLEASR